MASPNTQRSTLLPGWLPSGGATRTSQPLFDALGATAVDLQQAMTKKTLTSVQIVEEYISRIHEHNGYLKSVYMIAPGALDRAKELDNKRAAGEYLGPLHGIPVILKDNIATHPDLGMDTTAGAWALVGSEPAETAPLVEKLLSAGAIILGKSSMSEWAFSKGDGLPCGWSAVVGQTQSAYVEGGVDPNDSICGHSSPGGSSTGSAVSVSAGLVTLGVGTETEGSIIQPATRAGLFAIRPSYGIISNKGVIPVSYSYDTPGPFGKSPRDVADLLTALVDPTLTTVPEGGYASALNGSWADIKVGTLDPEIWRYSEYVTKRVPEATNQIMKDTEDAYAKIKSLAKSYHHHVPLKGREDFLQDGSNQLISLIGLDFKRDVNSYLTSLTKSRVRSMKEVIDWNIAHKDMALPEGYSSQANLERTEAANTSKEEIQKITTRVETVAGNFAQIMKEYDLDVIIGPGDCWLTQQATANHGPMATLPLSTLAYNGRPIGLSVAAAPHSEALLLKVMHAWTATFPPRPQPKRFRHINGKSEL